MKFKKSYVWLLIVLGIMVLTVSTVSASSFGSGDNEVIIDGVNFKLNHVYHINTYDEDVVSFYYGSNIWGIIETIVTSENSKFYTQNDPSRGYTTKKLSSYSIKGDVYAFKNKEEQDGGYFFIFEKGKKKFVYKIFSLIPSSNETIKTMCESMYLFSFENNLSTMVPKDGKSFSDCKKYFPEASKTVLKHVFDEADNNNDGVLSDSEFAKFKKVRDHTKNYAEDFTNNYPTKTASGKGTGYCADHGRVKLNSKNQCPYCLKLHYDPITKTSAW